MATIDNRFLISIVSTVSLLCIGVVIVYIGPTLSEKSDPFISSIVVAILISAIATFGLTMFHKYFSKTQLAE